MGVSNDILHRHGMLCLNDFVVIAANNNSVGMIIEQPKNGFSVKDINGNVSTYSRKQLRLATIGEIENAFRQLLFSL